MRLLGSALLFSVLLQAMVRPNDITTGALAANAAVVEVDLGKRLSDSIISNNKSFLFEVIFLNEVIVFLFFVDLNVQDVTACCFSGCSHSFHHFIHRYVPLSVCTNRGLADSHFHIQLLSNRYRWQHGFPGEISVALSCKRFHCLCAAASLFQTHRRMCLAHAGATLSSSPMLPPNEAKPQWTTLSLPPCTPGTLREVYASSPSLPTSLGTRWATTEIRSVWSPLFRTTRFVNCVSGDLNFLT